MTTKTTSNAKKKTPVKKTASKIKMTTKEKALTRQIEKLDEMIDHLELELSDQQERVQAAEEKMLRVVAEYENGKKRVEREKERSLKFAKERVLMGLFPIIDNLERSAKYESDEPAEDDTPKGVHLVLDQIKKYLKDTDDVEAYDPINEPFDPEYHEAMAMQPSEDVESGVVIDVFEKGYKSGERVLRAAKVVVSQ